MWYTSRRPRMSAIRRQFTKVLVCAAAACAVVPHRAHATGEAAIESDSFVDTIGVNIHAGHWLGGGGQTYDNDWTGICTIVGDLGIRHVRDHPFEVARLNQLTSISGATVDAIVEDFKPGTLRLDLTRLPGVLADAKSLTGLDLIEGPNEY